MLRRTQPPAGATHAAARTTENKQDEQGDTKGEPQTLPMGALDLRRMAQIARGKPTDHQGEVVLAPNAAFDISKTIFASLDSAVARAFISDKVGVIPFWSDRAEQQIRAAFKKVPKAPSFDKSLISFMSNKCDFAVEHADGSFMDHLKFCFEYSHRHFPERSPRVLLLHSIMGVGTNFFPMKKELIPELRALLTETEFQHIAIFPTMLRLLQSGVLMDKLVNTPVNKLKTLKSFTCHRVIDNKSVTVNAEVFWDHLNYQVIHLLDFLPAASWKLHLDDNFLRNFRRLHAVLTANQQLRCKLDYDAQEGSSDSSGQPKTLISLLRGVIPSTMALSMAQNALKKFSKKIGHSFEHKLEFAA